MGLSNSFLLPELAKDRARVTSGCPSLSPIERVVRDYRTKQRIKSDGFVKDKAAKDAALVAPDGERPTTLLEAQLGRPMTSGEISKRLLKLNPNFIFERSLADPTTMGIYLPDKGVTGGRRFLLGFEFGYSPEFTVNHLKEGKYQETRGWRQIIARLAKGGYISLGTAERMFKIASGPQSRNWKLVTR